MEGCLLHRDKPDEPPWGRVWTQGFGRHLFIVCRGFAGLGHLMRRFYSTLAGFICLKMLAHVVRASFSSGICLDSLIDAFRKSA